MGGKRDRMQGFERRYVRTASSDIEVNRMMYKGDMYRFTFKDGYGVLYTDRNCENLQCDEDSSVAWWDKDGREGCIGAGDPVDKKDIPKQSALGAILASGCCGWDFWAEDMSFIRFFGTLDEYGLFETFRIGGWNDKPFDGETEFKWEDLDTEEQVGLFKRDTLMGTVEYDRKRGQAVVA